MKMKRCWFALAASSLSCHERAALTHSPSHPPRSALRPESPGCLALLALAAIRSHTLTVAPLFLLVAALSTHLFVSTPSSASQRRLDSRIERNNFTPTTGPQSPLLSPSKERPVNEKNTQTTGRSHNGGRYCLLCASHSACYHTPLPVLLTLLTLITVGKQMLSWD